MKLYAIIFFMILVNVIFCQQSKPEIISTAGNYYSNSNSSVSWTLGEPVIETSSAGSNILTQGFQQSNYIISTVADIIPEFNISVFPNPVSDYIHLETESMEELKCVVFDINGKEILSESFIQKMQINLYQYPKASYIVKLYGLDEKLIKSLKIIKQ